MEMPFWKMWICVTEKTKKRRGWNHKRSRIPPPSTEVFCVIDRAFLSILPLKVLPEPFQFQSHTSDV